MTIYYDSSALLKININEEYSDFIRQFITKHKNNYISTLSFVELRSVFSRLYNNSQISENKLTLIKECLIVILRFFSKSKSIT